MTFNELYTKEIMFYKELSPSEALEYLGKSKQNGWHFNNSQTLCLSPEVLNKDGVIECINRALLKWNDKLGQVEEEDFIWE